MPLEVGTIAPDFTLTDTNKKSVTLSELKENVVLLFFPFAFTGTCTRELCWVRDDISQYQNLNTKVYGISVDSVFTLIKYKEDQHLNFDLLCDFNKDISAAYGSQYESFSFGMKGVAKRSAFVIDKNRIVKYAEVLDDAGLIPDFNAVKSVLNTLK